MSRVIATNEIKEEFDGVLETPLANFPFDFDVPSESGHELQTEEAHCSTATSTASNSSSDQLKNSDQNCTTKSNIAVDIESGDDESRSVEIAPMDSIPAHPTGQSQVNIRQSGRIEKQKKTDRESQPQMPNQVNYQEDAEDGDDEEEMSNTTNDNNVHSVVDSNEPSTSAQQQTNPIASKPPTGSNRQILTKRKQSQSNRSAKRSKKTVEDEGEEEEGEEDIATSKDRDDKKIKVGYLNCTQPDCGDKLDTLDLLHKHLRNKHGLPPLQCFCGCKSRFDNAKQISIHLRDRSAAKFSCPSCSQEFKTQGETYIHWYKHLTGRFQCKIDNCSKVFDTRTSLYSHHRHHCPESKRHQCPHNGCSSSFVHNKDLKRHQMIHLNTKPFYCKWHKCVHRTNRRSDLISHIRNIHLKKQQQNGIVGELDPNKYVRVAKK